MGVSDAGGVAGASITNKKKKAAFTERFLAEERNRQAKGILIGVLF